MCQHLVFIHRANALQLQVFTDLLSWEKPSSSRFPVHKLRNYTNLLAVRAGRLAFAVLHICQVLDSFSLHWFSFDSLAHNPRDVSTYVLLYFPIFKSLSRSLTFSTLIHQQCLSSEQVSSRASEVQWLSSFKPSREHFNVHLFTFMWGVFIVATLPKTTLNNSAFPLACTNTVWVIPWMNMKKKNSFSHNSLDGLLLIKISLMMDKL